MRKIELKTVKVETNEDVAKTGFELSYRTEFLRLVSTFPNGATIEDQRKLIKLNAKLRKAKENDTILLEEAEWEALKSNVASARFNFFAEEIVEMFDALATAKEIETTLLEQASKAKA